ncbi:efflux RND transporter periplasmic adaptor subunit [Tardiphaga sp.]|jgi:RND family efflux transporter MFP subunit|uniref:efflux RND transporter periplasmic adaptor subunit n=1 Tax=Tardiphaga sp. TaxID=1926292 RepID=UPI0037D9BA7D
MDDQRVDQWGTTLREPLNDSDAHGTGAGTLPAARAPEPSTDRHPERESASRGEPVDASGDADMAFDDEKSRGNRIAKIIATIAIAVIAVASAVLIWSYYVNAPWTRNGRVRVQVASVAPQVSGQISEVRVSDNQFVKKGDILYVIEPFDYKSARESAEAQMRMRAAEMQVKKVQAERRQALSDLSATVEDKQVFAGNAAQAQAAFDAAQVQLAQADVNLQRTEVRSPVNGYVTNLLLRVGDAAPAGTRNISIIDADSYWVDGYFEETKMANICIGDRAEAQLMGYGAPIIGRVDTITRGISDSNATPSTQGLPSVDPVYTWVRLAQRVPVRIAITGKPEDIPLVAGMTATVTIRGPETGNHGTEDHPGALTRIRQRFGDAIYGPTARPGCMSMSTPTPPAASIQSPTPPTKLPASSVVPGLTPGMTLPPGAK